MKKAKLVRPRHKVFTSLAATLLGGIIRLVTGYRNKRIKLPKEDSPYLIISNHVLAADPILLTLTFKEPVYYIASEHIFSKGFVSRILEFTFRPIPKSKSQIDFIAIKKMIEISKDGGNVGVFIEGNSTMTGNASSVPAAIGKLALKLKRPILIWNYDLGYLKNPRWSFKKRKGTFSGKIKEILKYEQYKDMSADELSDYLIKSISVNAYEINENQEFVGKHNAEGLERLLFTCFSCHEPNNVMTKGDTYTCKSCGFTMNYDNKGYLHASSFASPKTTVELNKDNLISYQNTLLENEDIVLTGHGKFLDLYQKRRVKRGKVFVQYSREGLTITFNRQDKQFFYSHNEIDTVAMAQKDNVIFYLTDGTTKMIILDHDSKSSSYQFVVSNQIFKNIVKHTSNDEEVIPLPSELLGL